MPSTQFLDRYFRVGFAQKSDDLLFAITFLYVQPSLVWNGTQTPVLLNKGDVSAVSLLRVVPIFSPLSGFRFGGCPLIELIFNEIE